MFEGFEHSKYTVNKQFFRLFGGAFRIFDPDGRLVLYADMKAFRLREDIRLYTGPDKAQELLLIKARQILDWSSAYDVIDAGTNEKVGALKRKGWQSLLRDSWIIMDANDQEIGAVSEDSMALALVRRFLTNLVPQTYHVDIGSMPVCIYRQRFNPFILKMDVDFTPDSNKLLDRRLGLAAAVLVCAIEGRQQ